MNKYVNLILACNLNGGIGLHGKLPWKAPSDIRFFKKITTECQPGKQNAVIMGRNTYNSIGKPLPGRINYVLSSSEPSVIPGTVVFKSLETAIQNACENEYVDRIFIIGGARVYNEMLEKHGSCIDWIYVTLVLGAHAACDSFIDFDHIRYGISNDNVIDMKTENGLVLQFYKFQHTIDEQNYLNLMKKIINTGDHREDRTKVGTISTFGERLVFDISHSIPFLTTKRLAWKTMLRELLWFIKGDTNNENLQAVNVHIWDGNTTREYLDSIGLPEREEGDLGPCFPAETLVLTDKGYQKIQNVNSSDLLFTHSGNWKPQKIMTRKYTGDIILLKFDGHPDFRATSEHPVYTRRQNGVIEWAPLSEISEGDCLGIKTGVNFVTQFPVVIAKDCFWYTIGYFIGNGYIQKYNNSEHIFFELLKSITSKKAYGYIIQTFPNIRVLKTTNKNVVYYCPTNLCDSIVLDYFKTINRRNIPCFVYSGNNGQQQKFLEGIYDSIGHFTTHKIFDNISLEMAYGIQKLYAKIGKKCAMHPNLLNPMACSLSVVGDCEISDILWIPIIYKKLIPTVDLPVYNFTVEDDNTYTAENFIVHNCYGFQWRHFGAEYTDCKADYTGKGVDQLSEVIRLIKEEPTSRRIIMSAWNPLAQPKMVLPPCHLLAQWYVRNGWLDCQMYQRSCDMALGVPFNIASYSVLTYMIAHVCGLKPGKFIHIMGDCHVYCNHVSAVQIQLERKPLKFPKLSFNRQITEITDFKESDFVLSDYKCHPTIKMEMAV